MASILPNGKTQFIDQGGMPLVGGKVFFYAPGTSTPQDTYQDSAATIRNANPVQLDSRGQATIWGLGTYRQVVQDVNGVTIWDQVVSDATAAIAAQFAALSTVTGASQIGYKDTGAGAVAQTVQDVLRESISVLRFGAKGDGSHDDYPAIQAALVAAQGKTLYFPTGIYKLASGSPRIYSNTKIIGDGEGRTILVQPNYYSYDRASYNKSAVVDWNGLWMDVGTQNVTIDGFEIRGAFYQTSAAGYTAAPVQSWPANNGIHVRGRDYQWRQGLAPIGESFNIRITNCRVEGFAEDAIQLDNVTNAWVEDNTLTRCGRGGVRGYGLQRGWVLKNRISYLSPGDYLNQRLDPNGNPIGGNRMYGVTFTRMYGGALTDYRPSMWCTASFNKVSYSPYWKGLDTHGGQFIDFICNQIEECHIGIGIDKGGYTTDDGIAPPSNIRVIGNVCIRTIPDDPNEGDNGFAGAGLECVANDQTDLQVGRTITVADNTFIGWGEDSRFGAVFYSDWIGVVHHSNNIQNSRRAAVCIRERFEGCVEGDSIDDVRASTLAVQLGIDIETANARGRIGDTTFINRQATALTAISLASPATGYGFVVSAGHQFTALGAGAITRITHPNYDQEGPWSMQMVAAARIAANGALTGGRGVLSVTNPSTGVYVITLEQSMAATASLWPTATPQNSANGRTTNAAPTAVNQVTVYMRDSSWALVNDSFTVHVFGY